MDDVRGGGSFRAATLHRNCTISCQFVMFYDSVTFRYNSVTNVRGIRLDSAELARILLRIKYDLKKYIEKKHDFLGRPVIIYRNT